MSWLGKKFREGRDWTEAQFSRLTLFGVLLLLISAIPDWKARIDFWKESFRWVAGHLTFAFSFFQSGSGRLILVAAGLLIIWADHRRVVGRQARVGAKPIDVSQDEKMLAEATDELIEVPDRMPTGSQDPNETESEPGPEPASHPEASKNITIEACWVERCLYDIDNPMIPAVINPGDTHDVALVDFANIASRRIISIVGKVTYYDVQGRPYLSAERVLWKDRYNRVSIEDGASKQLAVAFSDANGRCFAIDYLLDDAGESRLPREVDLKRGNGFAAVRLNYELSSGEKDTEKFFFSVKLAKKLQITPISSIPAET